MWTSAAIPCRPSGYDPPPACVVFRLALKGDSSPTLLVGCERAPCLSATSQLSAASSVACRQLRFVRTLVAVKQFSNTCPARRQDNIKGVSSFEKKHQTCRAGDLDVGVHIIFKKALRIEASRKLRIRVSQPPDFTPPSSQPCQARHGYRVTKAHCEKVGLSVDELASAMPLRGRLWRAPQRSIYFAELGSPHLACG
jgi:hypothetical protein